MRKTNRLFLICAICLICSGKLAAQSKSIINSNKPVIIDYLGSEFGNDIPEWVINAGMGNQKKVIEDLKLAENKKVFVLFEKADDLAECQRRTEKVNIINQLSSVLSYNPNEANSVETIIDEIFFPSLKKEAFFWVLVEQQKNGVKKVKSEADVNRFYNYYVVYSIEQNIFDSIISNSLKQSNLDSVIINQLKEILGN